jgi:hypothetical protein
VLRHVLILWFVLCLLSALLLIPFGDIRVGSAVFFPNGGGLGSLGFTLLSLLLLIS